MTHQVYKNLGLFMKGKEGGDDLFDRLTVRGLPLLLKLISFLFRLDS